MFSSIKSNVLNHTKHHLSEVLVFTWILTLRIDEIENHPLTLMILHQLYIYAKATGEPQQQSGMRTLKGSLPLGESSFEIKA
jgi:hypothetical protein